MVRPCTTFSTGVESTDFVGADVAELDQNSCLTAAFEQLDVGTPQAMLDVALALITSEGFFVRQAESQPLIQHRC